MEGRQPLWQLAQPNGHGKKKRKKSDVYLTNFSRYFSYFLVQHFVSLSNIFSAPFLFWVGTSQIVTDSLGFYQVYKIGIGNNNNDHRSVISIF
jgi:hypothetical protein